MRATLDAYTELKDGRFTYEIYAESGSGLIRSKVLKTALETEQKAQTRESRDEAALSHANYEFAAMSVEADRQLRLQIRPRRRHVMLIDGSLAIDAGSLDLLTVEGELSKRPSFWTRRVHITREYQRLAGVHVPVAMRSRADSFSVALLSWPQAARMSRPRGVRTGEA